MKIHKYHLSSQDVEIELPLGAEVLKVDMQRGELMLWALVEDWEDRRARRRFVTYPTGMSGIRIDDQHIDTVFDGDFVWHVFERFS